MLMKNKKYINPENSRATILLDRSRQQENRSRTLSESEVESLSEGVQRPPAGPLPWVAAPKSGMNSNIKENIQDVREWAEYISDKRLVQGFLSMSDEQMSSLMVEFLQTYFSSSDIRMTAAQIDEFVQWAVTAPYQRHL
jgi:hypothetical protein